MHVSERALTSLAWRSAVTKLNNVRDEAARPASGEGEHDGPNRVDSTLTDVFSLVSLFFLVVRPTSTVLAVSLGQPLRDRASR